ncbi:hypothetical protein [Antarctobacter jejuensis]|uniref:hypothetical protein n=1 Tax=Antarctobacter jejuensis TaxID=1439938 RepID=UPI003FD638E1
MARGLISFGARSLLYLVAFFPLFYLAYKFHVPDFGGSDYYHYHRMYLSPLDFSAADAPWVLRQIQAVIVNLLFEAGLDYDTDIAFTVDGFERGVFFSALAVNYISVVLTAALLGGHLQRQTGRPDALSLFVPAVMVLNFSVLFFAYSGLTEGLSLLMFTAAYLAYRAGRYLVCALVVLAAAFQRELIPLILLALIAADLIAAGWQQDGRARLTVLICAALSLGAHVLLRANLPGDSHGAQLSPHAWLDAFSGFGFADGDFLFQVLLTQNFAALVALAALMFTLTLRRLPRVDRWLVIDCGVTFAVILGVGIAASVGNNVGRLLIFCTPSLAMILAGIARDWTAPSDAEIRAKPNDW